MKENQPTIQEISDLFIPKQFRECLVITEITPEEIFLNVKKTGTLETKLFLEHFTQIAKMLSIDLYIEKKI
ncbi:hypothetical protein Q1W71_22080 [Flavobacterium pectinovorum]|uniref:hypothetical protein n=1 Tax=Flavobacterium pectinovorum TaxID=29533 RepID=UPI00265E873E|nr:hypothetical protein [Flavobacterium pectinovorum]WKL47631.1 hypothetical protein Q1W71_22080 [Flavobacterium pectinovorum]